MGTLKVMLRTSHQKQDGTYPIVFRVTEDRAVKFISSKLYVKENQFKDGIVVKHPDSVLYNQVLEKKRSQLIAEVLSEERKIPTLKEAFTKLSHYYESNQMAGAFNRVIVTEKIAIEAMGNIFLNRITPEKVQDYILFRLNRGNNPNTIKKNLRDLGNVLKFNNYTGPDYFSAANKKIKSLPVHKTKLSVAEIKKIEDADLDNLYDVARDMFLFSYYTHGMRFENVATFSTDMIKGETLQYRMNKGKKIREIELHPKLKKIIAKYTEAKTLYLFPVVKVKHDLWSKKEIIGSANTLINRYLQGALIMAGVDQKLSFHSGRYSFANNADKTGVSRSVLSQAMGHSSVKVTEIYLNSFNDDEINEAVKGMYES